MSLAVTTPEGPPDADGARRVLVVDDEPFMCKAALAMLKALGCEAEAVSSGEEAIECVARSPRRFDCALIDFSMIPMDGLTCAQAILAKCSSIRIVIMSGYNIEDRIREFRSAGVATVIQKPLTLGMLRQHIAPSDAP